MSVLLNLIGVIASLVLSFISSGMETALYRVSRVRMRVSSDRGNHRAAGVLNVLDRLDSMVTTILIDNNIAAYTGTYFLNMQFTLWAVPHSELITTAIITPLFFVLTESLPKQLAFTSADRWTLSLVRVFSVFRTLLSPFVWILNRASSCLRSLLGSKGNAEISQSRRALLVENLNAGVAERVISEEQSRMAGRIMQLQGISAGDSMISLRTLTLIPVASTRARAVKEMSRRRTRMALLTDTTGRPTGQVVSLNALVQNPGEAADPVLNFAETPAKIGSFVAIPEVLALFHDRHARLALVMERNRVAGIITTQSVLDRIAGISR